MNKNLKGALAAFLFVTFGCFYGVSAASINNNKNLDGTIGTKAGREADLNSKSALTLNKTTDVLEEGCEDKLTALINNKPENKVEKLFTNWSTSDISVVDVDFITGELRANGIGQATITVKYGDETASCVVTVKPYTGAAMKLNKTVDILNKGDVDQLSVQATLGNIDGKTTWITPDSDKITWTTTNQSIAKVDANGEVTAVGRGTAWITASYGSKIDICMVNVSDGEHLVINKPVENMKVGDTDTLSATKNGEIDKSVTFMTNNSFVASVNGKDNKLTAYKKGTALIVAVSEDGTMALCTVTVE